MSFSWSSQDTDFYAAQISSLAIPGDEEIYDPYNLQQSIDHYESLSRAPIWEKHNNYRVGDKVVHNSIVFECIQNYIYSSFPNINTSDTSYWTNIGPVIDHSFTQEDVTQNNKELEKHIFYSSKSIISFIASKYFLFTSSDESDSDNLSLFFESSIIKFLNTLFFGFNL